MNIELGRRLRHLRRLRALKLAELAREVGCSEGFLSKVESGKAAPSLNLLHRLGEALDANIAQLFGSTDADGEIVLRPGQRPFIEDLDREHGGIRLERLIAPSPERLLQASLHHLTAGAASEGEITHFGEEFGYVLEGHIELTVDARAYRLGPGDAFHFESDRPHAYRNLGTAPARIVWINTPPTY